MAIYQSIRATPENVLYLNNFTRLVSLTQEKSGQSGGRCCRRHARFCEHGRAALIQRVRWNRRETMVTTSTGSVPTENQIRRDTNEATFGMRAQQGIDHDVDFSRKNYHFSRNIINVVATGKRDPKLIEQRATNALGARRTDAA